jgi:hypothetical protein
MRRRHGPELIFRVYAEHGSRLYFRVKIFRTVRDMRAYARRRSPGARFGHFLGLASTWTKLRYSKHRQRWRTLPECGEILFAKHRLQVGILSHECTHAAIGWAKRRGLHVDRAETFRPLVPDDEERLCHVQGHLVSQIVRQLYARQYLFAPRRS